MVVWKRTFSPLTASCLTCSRVSWMLRFSARSSRASLSSCVLRTWVVPQ